MAGPFGWHPGLFLPRGRPEAGGRPGPSATCPAQPHPRPAQGRVSQAGSPVSMLGCFVRSVSFPARPACWPAPGRVAWQHFFPSLSTFFSSNGIFLEPPIKGTSSPFSYRSHPLLSLLHCQHFESSIPSNPSDDSCPNLGKQERRSRSIFPPNKISSK